MQSMFATGQITVQAGEAAGVRIWIASETLAQLAGISERKSRAALERARNGAEWRGHPLSTRQIHGRGGKSGYRLLVAIESLPSDIQARFRALPSESQIECAFIFEDESSASVEAPEQCGRKGPVVNPSMEALCAQLLLNALRPILAIEKHQPGRGSAIRQSAEHEYLSPDGERIKFSEKQLRRALEKYERHGAIGLFRKERADKSIKRVAVTRTFDDLCPLDTSIKNEIGARLVVYIKSLWSSGKMSWPEVARLAQTYLLEDARESGWPAADLKACIVSRRLVDLYKDFQAVAVAENDAKGHHDKVVPRAKRHRDGMLPGDVVVGDVHPIDIAVRRLDGSIAYPRAIAWLDVATNRLHLTLILLEKNEGVNREHVALSFIRMCAVFGLPKTIYLDNGSEFSWTQMLDGFKELARLTAAINVLQEGDLSEDESIRSAIRSVIRARPYAAQSKPIEGIFAVIESGPLAKIPGWVGGNRMSKKTHNVGREPKPYPGTFAEFCKDVETAIDWYHSKPQKKQASLKGRSPAEAYGEFIAEGWAKTAVDEKTLMVAFASEESRIPDRGYVQWHGATFYHDDLLPYTGRSIAVRVMALDSRFLFAFDGEQMICAAEPAKTFAFTDPRGAREQAHRAKRLRRYIGDMRSAVGRLDLVAEMRRDMAHRSGMPEAPIGTVISVTPKMQQILAAIDAKDEQHERDDILPPPVESDSVWLPRGAIDKHLAALKYEPEDDETEDTTDEER